MATVSTNSDIEDIGIIANGEVVTINSGATLTIDSDPQWGLTGFYLGGITVDEGTCLIDARNIRIIDYDGGSLSAAPSLGDTCTGGTSGATGEVVYVDTSSGTVTGTVKLKTVSGDFRDNETLTFTTPTGSALAACRNPSTGTVTTANGAGTTLIDNTATFITDGVKLGDKVLNTTDGSSGVVSSVDSQTQLTISTLTGGTDNDFDSSDAYQIGADHRGWILVVGERTSTITVNGLGSWQNRGEWYDLGTGDGTASQTFNHYVTDVVPAVWVETGLGTNVYEIWLNIDRDGLSSCGAGELGHFFTSDNTTTTLTFGNGTNGAVVPNGARVKVPNIHFSTTDTTNWATQTRIVETNPALNWEISTNGGGELDIDKMIGGGFFIASSNATNITMLDCAIHKELVITDPVNDITLTNVGVGGNLSADADNASGLSLDNVSGVITNTFVLKNLTSGSGGFSLNNCDTTTITDCGCFQANRTSGASAGFYISNSNNITVNNYFIAGFEIQVLNSNSITFNDTVFSGELDGVKTTASAINLFVITNNVNDITVNGLTISPNGVPCYDEVFFISQVNGMDLRNIGSSSSKFDMDNHSQHFIWFNANVVDFRAARVYVANSRDNRTLRCEDLASNVLKFWNCDFDNAREWEILSKNIEVRAVKASDGTLDTTDGIETDLTSVAGYHCFDMFSSTTQGMIGLVMTPKTGNSISASSYEVNSGTPVFDKSGNLLMRTSGDQITWTWPWDILGHTSFQNLAMVFQGTNQGNHTFEYDLDTGSGYSGIWNTINGTNLNGETISATGFRMKIRVTCTTTNSGNSISGLLMETNTNTAAQDANLHEIDTVDVNITGILAGSNYRIEKLSDSSLLASGTAGGDVSTQIAVSAGTQIKLIVGLDDYKRFESTATAAASGTEFVVIQVLDSFRVADDATALAYSGIAIDGGAQTITVTAARTQQELYDYAKAWSIQISNLQYDVPITTVDGVTFNQTSGWSITVSGSGQLISETTNIDGTVTVASGGFYEGLAGAKWETGGNIYYASHFWINVKDNDTNGNIQDSVVAFIEDDTGTDVTFNTSLVNGALTTDSNGDVEGYVVYQVDASPYSSHTQLVGEYNYNWSSIPRSVNGSQIGNPTTNLGVRLTGDIFVTLSKAAALTVSGITTTHTTSTLDASDESYNNVYDNLKARQARTADIEAGKEGFISYYEEGFILEYDGSFFNLSPTWTIQNITDSGVLKGGTVELGTPGTVSFDFTDVTINYTFAGTYDHRNTIQGGTITLENTSGGSVTAQFDTSVTTVNNGPNITVDKSAAVVITVNCVDNNGNAVNFATGSRFQLYNVSGASASAWASTTAYSLGDKILRTSGAGTESGAGLWMECTSAGTSGGSEPTWTTTLGGTTSDGTCTWTTRAIEMYNAQPGATDNFTVNYTYLTTATIRWRVISVDGATSTEWKNGNISVTASGANLSVEQESNAIYDSNAIDGSTVTECSISSNGIDIYVDDPDNTTTAQRIYNWYQYYLSTEDGIRDSDDYIIATDQTHYVWDNTLEIRNVDTVNPLQITGANIVPTSGSSTDIFDLSNGASIALNFERVEGFAYSVGSGLTTAQDAKLFSIPTDVWSVDLTSFNSANTAGKVLKEAKTNAKNAVTMAQFAASK